MDWHVPRKHLPSKSSSWDSNVKRKVLCKVAMEKKTKNSLRWPRNKPHIEHVIPNTRSLKNITDCYNCGGNRPANRDLCPAGIEKAMQIVWQIESLSKNATKKRNYVRNICFG